MNLCLDNNTRKIMSIEAVEELIQRVKLKKYEGYERDLNALNSVLSLIQSRGVFPTRGGLLFENVMCRLHGELPIITGNFGQDQYLWFKRWKNVGATKQSIVREHDN